MFDLREFTKDIPLINELGLIAVKQGDEEGARKLFTALALLQPESTMTEMGYGLIAIHKMDTKIAQKHFENVLNKEPENWRAQAFMAFVHMLAVMNAAKVPIDSKEQLIRLKKSVELAQGVLENSEEKSTIELAQSILDWHRDLEHSLAKS